MLILANTFTFGLFGGFIAILSSVIILILYDMFLIGGPGARNHRNAMSQAASMQPRRCPPLLLKSRNKFRTSLLSRPGLAASFSLLAHLTTGADLRIFFVRRRSHQKKPETQH